MGSRDRAQLQPKLVLKVGAEVEAPCPVNKRDWPAVVEEIADGRIYVKFTNIGPSQTKRAWFDAADVQWGGYYDAQKLLPASGKRERNPPGNQEAVSGVQLESEEDEEEERKEVRHTRTHAKKQKKQRREDDDSDSENEITMITEHMGEGDERKYKAVLRDGRVKWYKRECFLGEGGVVTAALLLYERKPAVIIQRSGDEILVQWEGMFSTGWSNRHSLLLPWRDWRVAQVRSSMRSLCRSSWVRESAFTGHCSLRLHLVRESTLRRISRCAILAPCSMGTAPLRTTATASHITVSRTSESTNCYLPSTPTGLSSATNTASTWALLTIMAPTAVMNGACTSATSRGLGGITTSAVVTPARLNANPSRTWSAWT